MQRTARIVVTATLIAGTLDILYAFLLATRSPLEVLRSVASGPFGTSMNQGGWHASAAGLAVHFAIMTIMVCAFVWASRRWSLLIRQPLIAGLAYGLLLYVIMYWIVLPLRWPGAFPVTDAVEIGKGLFAHLILVGLPIALVTARGARATS